VDSLTLRIQGVWPPIAENSEDYFATLEPIVDEASVHTLLGDPYNYHDLQYLPNFTCPVPIQLRGPGLHVRRRAGDRRAVAPVRRLGHLR
jgi:hypothetical protein